jgi:hypothetical protein
MCCSDKGKRKIASKSGTRQCLMGVPAGNGGAVALPKSLNVAGRKSSMYTKTRTGC